MILYKNVFVWFTSWWYLRINFSIAGSEWSSSAFVVWKLSKINIFIWNCSKTGLNSVRGQSRNIIFVVSWSQPQDSSVWLTGAGSLCQGKELLQRWNTATLGHSSGTKFNYTNTSYRFLHQWWVRIPAFISIISMRCVHPKSKHQ